MITSHSHKLTWRQAIARVTVSVALGTALALAILGHGISSSHAKVEPGPPGTAAAQLSVLQRAPVDRSAPSAVQAGFDGGSADADAVRLLGANISGKGVSMYASARSNGGACNAISTGKEAVGTVCVDSVPASGITLGASDAGGWSIYGFAADDVVGVDVVLAGKPQPAAMLANAYLADLGPNGLSDVSALLVHHSDGSTISVQNDLRAPGS